MVTKKSCDRILRCIRLHLKSFFFFFNLHILHIPPNFESVLKQMALTVSNFSFSAIKHI